MNINFGAIIDIFKKCQEYTQIIERLNALENDVAELKNQITNTDKTRICPYCHKPTLDIDYIEKNRLASYNSITGEKAYGKRKMFIARCSSCGWECDDQSFINQRLHP